MFDEFERLVNYAVGGSMLDSEVCGITSQLKNEKAKIMRAISKSTFSLTLGNAISVPSPLMTCRSF